MTVPHERANLTAVDPGQTPRDYAMELVQALATRKERPVSFGPKQMDFLAVVVSKVEEVLAARRAFVDGTSSTAKVEQLVVLLHGPGGVREDRGDRSLQGSFSALFWPGWGNMHGVL